MHAEVFLQPDRPHPILGSTHGPTRECLTRNHFRYADPINLGVDLPARKSALIGRKPDLPRHSVCFECKARGTTCVTVARGLPAWVW